MHAVLVRGFRFNRLAPILAGALVGCAACSAQAPPPAAKQQAQAAPAADNAPNHVDINTIFPAGPGRELVLNNCTSCHTFVPIVILQMNKDEWERSSRNHRSRVPGLSDDEFKTLYTYLVANFNPDHPVPVLPKELLATWTTY
jgi:cytochrome c5